MAAVFYERDNCAAAFPSIVWCQSNKQEINISNCFCFPSNLVRGSWLWRISWGIKEIRKGEMFEWTINMFKKISSQSLTWTSKFFSDQLDLEMLNRHSILSYASSNLPVFLTWRQWICLDDSEKAASKPSKILMSQEVSLKSAFLYQKSLVLLVNHNPTSNVWRAITRFRFVRPL